jgi:hypothetical protein
MAEKLMLAIEKALVDEKPLEDERNAKYEDYKKADNVYMKSRRNIAELCAGLDALVPAPKSYPLPDVWGANPGLASREYFAVQERCHELRRIAESNRRLEERNRKEAEEARARGETDIAQRGPQEVV